MQMRTKQIVLTVAVMAMMVMPLYATGTDDDGLLKWLRRSNAVYSPLEAAEFGSVEKMKAAVMIDPLQVNAVDELGRTALHIAAAKGKPDVVRILLEAGANPNAVDAHGKKAVDYAKGEVLELLK